MFGLSLAKRSLLTPPQELTLNSLAWWEDGRCVGENNNDLVGELKGNDVTQNECAILCSEELKITACEYDKVKQSCTAHTQIVTSGSSSSPNKHYDDVNKQCSIILAKGL